MHQILIIQIISLFNEILLGGGGIILIVMAFQMNKYRTLLNIHRRLLDEKEKALFKKLRELHHDRK